MARQGQTINEASAEVLTSRSSNGRHRNEVLVPTSAVCPHVAEEFRTLLPGPHGRTILQVWGTVECMVAADQHVHVSV